MIDLLSNLVTIRNDLQTLIDASERIKKQISLIENDKKIGQKNKHKLTLLKNKMGDLNLTEEYSHIHITFTCLMLFKNLLRMNYDHDDPVILALTEGMNGEASEELLDSLLGLEKTLMEHVVFKNDEPTYKFGSTSQELVSHAEVLVREIRTV